MEHETTAMGPSWASIMALAAERSRENSPILTEMREIRDRYNGDIVYPWADALTEGQEAPDLTPQLIAESIDNYGLRAASVLPALIVPSAIEGKEKGDGSRDWARRRRLGLAATLGKNHFPLIARRFMRHLAGYATATLIVEPDFQRGMPRIRVINPLNAFPDQRTAENFEDPTDGIFIHQKSAAWLRATYPMCRHEYGGQVPLNDGNLRMWDLVSYMDADVLVTGLAGRSDEWRGRYEGNTLLASRDMELSRIPNRIGKFPGISMGRVTLDRLTSALTSTVGLIDWAARLQLLDVIAAEKAIFPDTYITGDGRQTPKIVTNGGRWADGRTGVANIVTGATSLGQLRATPDPAGKQTIDRMERNVRSSMGLPSQFGGETSNAVRSGRGVEALLNASIDPRIAELQDIAAAWVPTLFEAILDCWFHYFPDAEQSLDSQYPGSEGLVHFTPGMHFRDTRKVSVAYPIAGADIQLTNIILSQMKGAGAISNHTFRTQHPWVKDADGETRRVGEERLEEIAWQSLTQQAMGGQIPIEQIAMIEEEWRGTDGTDIFHAIREATAKLKAEQAREAEAAQAGQTMDPATAPGLGGPSGPLQPGAGDPSAQIAPTPGMGGVRELQNALAAGSRRVNGVTGPQ